MAQRRGRASKPARAGGRTRRSRRRGTAPRSETAGRNVAAVREIVTKSMLAPLNAVLLTRRHIEEVVEDAVRRGRMTRDDAQQMLQTLLQRGAQQTDDFLTDLERLLGRGRGVDERSPAVASGGRSARSSRRGSGRAAPIAGYDELSAAAVQERLNGLSPAELRTLRDYERRNANRKTVLDRIERKLR
jgi:hypothetical protein